MSWTDFAYMIDAGAGATTAEWQNAMQGNLNSPQNALKGAILERILVPNDTAALDRLCALVIELAQRCIDRTEYARQYHDTAIRLADENSALLQSLESLTPGGSEFSGNPKACLQFVRERLSATGKVASERNRLREACVEAKEWLEHHAYDETDPGVIGLIETLGALTAVGAAAPGQED